MKSIIICKSVHKGNTKEVAEAVAGVLDCEVKEPGEVDGIEKYDLVGFAAGIYYGDFHRSIIDFVETVKGDGKHAFLVSTSGFRPLPFFNNYEEKMEERLEESGFEVLGSFTCRGHDEFGPLKLFGGMYKNRPNGKDLKDAKSFAEKLLESVKS